MRIFLSGGFEKIRVRDALAFVNVTPPPEGYKHIIRFESFRDFERFHAARNVLENDDILFWVHGYRTAKHIRRVVGIERMLRSINPS